MADNKLDRYVQACRAADLAIANDRGQYPVMCEICEIQSFVDEKPDEDARVVCTACALKPNLLRAPKGG